MPVEGGFSTILHKRYKAKQVPNKDSFIRARGLHTSIIILFYSTRELSKPIDSQRPNSRNPDRRTMACDYLKTTCNYHKSSVNTITFFPTHRACSFITTPDPASLCHTSVLIIIFDSLMSLPSRPSRYSNGAVDQTIN